MSRACNHCSLAAREFYSLFVESTIALTNSRTAELVKLTENACRDVEIAFANELSIICDNLGVDVWELIGLANRHPRINILQPGPGVGGHCIAVDPWFIVADDNQNTVLIQAARNVNNGKIDWVVDKIFSTINEILEEVQCENKISVALYGLTYKSDIDDFRESPSIKIFNILRKKFKGQILLVDPYLSPMSPIVQRNDVVVNPTVVEADIHVILVRHKEFKNLVNRFGASDKVIDIVGITR